jgi:MurNAc alpha-1-phosphate uridylyltransferase
MILAAGLGTRMRPLTNTTPKPLLTVAGVALIDYHIKALKAAGITEIVVNTAHLAEKIHQHLGDGSKYGVTVKYSDEDKPLETLGGIEKALAKLTANEEDAFIVVNGDVYAEVDFKQLITNFKAANKQGHLLLVDNPEFHPKGDFAIDGSTGVNLLSNSTELPRYTFAGISILTAALINSAIAEEKANGALAPLLRRVADKGNLSAEHFTGSWFDVGTPERLAEVNDFVSAKNAVK